jgi:hypothetical protein
MCAAYWNWELRIGVSLGRLFHQVTKVQHLKLFSFEVYILLTMNTSNGDFDARHCVSFRDLGTAHRFIHYYYYYYYYYYYHIYVYCYVHYYVYFYVYNYVYYYYYYHYYYYYYYYYY